jgi:protein-L-isoaspartate(D-aspartate) O-methyltransferase
MGPLVAGAADRAPFDAILVNGSVSEELPAGILDQLKDGGRAVAVLARGAVGKATVWHRSGSHIDSRPIFDAGAPLLPGFEPAAGFVF